MDIYSSSKGKHAAKKNTRPMSKQKKRTVIILTAVVSLLAALLLSAAGYFLWLIKDYNYHKLDDPDIAAIKPISAGVINIALFGIDAREQKSFKGLSDSIMVLSINTDTGELKLISIMRDSLVPIPGYSSPKKINSAYSLGGPELAIQTLNKNFGLDIREYATVNFYGMADIIDAVGGLEIEVTKGEINARFGINAMIGEQSLYMNIDPPLVKEPGLQTLNGVQAVSWARIRHAATADGVNDDYGRTDRQRHVMELLLNKALSMSKSQYPKLIKALLPYMETSLSYSDILKLAGVLTKKITFTQTRVPQPEYLMNPPSGFGSVVYYDLDFASDIIYNYIYKDTTQEDYLDEHGIKRNSWYGRGSSGGSSGGSGGNSDNGGSGGGTTTTTDPVVEDPIIDDPVTEDPIVDDPITEDPTLPVDPVGGDEPVDVPLDGQTEPVDPPVEEPAPVEPTPET